MQNVLAWITSLRLIHLLFLHCALLLLQLPLHHLISILTIRHLLPQPTRTPLQQLLHYRRIHPLNQAHHHIPANRYPIHAAIHSIIHLRASQDSTRRALAMDL
jgi:hypothetical protein